MYIYSDGIRDKPSNNKNALWAKQAMDIGVQMNISSGDQSLSKT